VAKAVTAPPTRPRVPVAAAGGGRGRAGLVEYFRGVWEELRKVQWPARDELLRMTGIVIATVFIFGVIIGGADYLLSVGVKQLYTTNTNTSTTTTNNAASSSAAATARPATSLAPSAAPKTTPVP
jgi:preprotein translocase SecE subunit